MNEKEVIENGEGENYNYAQDHCYIKLASTKTNGELCFVEDTLKPGFYLGRHHHKVMTEVFYILEGEVELILMTKQSSLNPEIRSPCLPTYGMPRDAKKVVRC